MTDENPPVAVVTGASRGLGYAASLALARNGVHLVALARTTGGLEELDDEIKASGGSATLVPLDLKDMDGIDRLGAVLYERWGRVDMLLGNAGLLGAITPVAHFEPKVWDDVFTINVTANWRLIRSLDPLLRNAPAGRALFVTSGAAQRCRPYWGAYSASKAALDAMVRTYAKELKPSSATANLFDPGRMRTAMRARAAPGENPESVTPPREVARDIVRMLSPEYADNGVMFDYAAQTTTALDPE